MASARSASLDGGLGAEPLVGVNFHTNKWPKVKHLNENLSPFLRQTVSCRHDVHP